MSIFSPTTLREALAFRAETPDALVIAGGTDVLVGLNFGRLRARRFLDVSRVEELRELTTDNGLMRIGAGVTFAAIARSMCASVLPALAEAARTVGSPQIRNRATIGGNLGTCSPAGDALPPLAIELAEVELTSRRETRRLPLSEFQLGPKKSALRADELITAILLRPSGGLQTFMKVGPRNAMVISVVSLAIVVDREREEVRAAYGSAGPTVGTIAVPLAHADSLPEALNSAASPIDDQRGTADYRRRALAVLARRGLARCAS